MIHPSNKVRVFRNDSEYYPFPGISGRRVFHSDTRLIIPRSLFLRYKRMIKELDLITKQLDKLENIQYPPEPEKYKGPKIKKPRS